MEQKKNLCAQIPLSLHTQVSEAREAAGRTLATAAHSSRLPRSQSLQRSSGRPCWTLPGCSQR